MCFRIFEVTSIPRTPPPSPPPSTTKIGSLYVWLDALSDFPFLDHPFHLFIYFSSCISLFCVSSHCLSNSYLIISSSVYLKQSLWLNYITSSDGAQHNSGKHSCSNDLYYYEESYGWFSARNAIVVIVAAGATAILIENGIDVFSVTGHIRSGLPPFQFPNFTMQYNNETISAGQILGVSTQRNHLYMYLFFTDK